MLKALLPQAKQGEVASIAKGVNFTRPHPWACEAVFSSRSPVFTGGFVMMFICSLWIRNCYFLIDIWRQWSKSNIHPFSIAYLGSGHGGRSLSREAWTSLTPATRSSSSRGNTESVLNQLRYIISAESPGSAQRPPLNRTCQKKLPDTQKVSMKHPRQMSEPPQLCCFGVVVAVLPSPSESKKHWIYWKGCLLLMMSLLGFSWIRPKHWKIICWELKSLYNTNSTT